MSLGTPAVVDRLAFVPWQNQYVSVLDVTDGSEVGRALLREKTSRAWTVGGGLYFGEAGIFRFDDKNQTGRRAAPRTSRSPRASPGSPAPHAARGDEATPSVAGAGDKIPPLRASDAARRRARASRPARRRRRKLRCARTLERRLRRLVLRLMN